MTDYAPESVPPPLSEPAPPLPVSGKCRSGCRAVGVRLKRKRSFFDWVAFLLSAVLSPYLVIPVGTIAIIYARSPHTSYEYLLWTGISLFFSTVLPLLYILFGMWRGTISDVHVMERDQRGTPFLIAIIGGFLGAFLLFLLQSPKSVWGLSVIQAVNGLVILLITYHTKISVHVAVLSATVIGAAALHPAFSPYAALCLIPTLMWARTRRGRHSWLQGLGGFFVSSSVTSLVIVSLGLSNRLTSLWYRLVGHYFL